MGKFFLIMVLAFGAAMYFPQTRPALMDLLRPVLNPVFVWQTKSEMDQVLRELQLLNREGRAIPEPGAPFQAWMERNFQGGSLRDSWGGSYTLEVWLDSLGVVSRGPDLEIDTEDDVVRTTAIQRPRGR